MPAHGGVWSVVVVNVKVPCEAAGDTERFCVVRLGDKDAPWEIKGLMGDCQQWRSNTIEHAASLDFEFSFSFDCYSRAADSLELHIRVYNGSCDVLGELTLPVKKRRGKLVDLNNAPSRGARIAVRVHSSSTVEDTMNGNAEDPSPVATHRSIQSGVHVAITAATGLRDSDGGGESDSADVYCLVRAGGVGTSWAAKFRKLTQHQWRSLTQRNAKGAPSFEMDFQVGTVLLPIAQTSDDAELHIRLFDKDVWNRDDFLGEARLPLTACDSAMHALKGVGATGSVMLELGAATALSDDGIVMHGSVEKFGDPPAIPERGAPAIPSRIPSRGSARGRASLALDDVRSADSAALVEEAIKKDRAFNRSHAGWIFRLDGDAALFEGRGQDRMRQAVLGCGFRPLNPPLGSRSKAAAKSIAVGQGTLAVGALVEFGASSSVAAAESFDASRVTGTFKLTCTWPFDCAATAEGDLESLDMKEDCDNACDTMDDDFEERAALLRRADDRRAVLSVDVRRTVKKVLHNLLGVDQVDDVVLVMSSKLKATKPLPVFDGDAAPEGQKMYKERVAALMQATSKMAIEFEVKYQAFVYDDDEFHHVKLGVLQSGGKTATGALEEKLYHAWQNEDIEVNVHQHGTWVVCSDIEPASAALGFKLSSSSEGGFERAVLARGTVVVETHPVFAAFAVVKTCGVPSTRLLVRRAALKIIPDSPPIYVRWDPGNDALDALPQWAIPYRSESGSSTALREVKLCREEDDPHSWSVVMEEEGRDGGKTVVLRGKAPEWRSAAGTSSRPSDLNWMFKETGLLGTRWTPIPALRLVRWTPPRPASRVQPLFREAETPPSPPAQRRVRRALPSLPPVPHRTGHHAVSSPPPPPPVPHRTAHHAVLRPYKSPMGGGEDAASSGMSPPAKFAAARMRSAKMAEGGVFESREERRPNDMVQSDRESMMKTCAWALCDLVDSPVGGTINATMAHRRAPLTEGAGRMVCEALSRRGDQLRFVSAWGEDGECADWGTRSSARDTFSAVRTTTTHDTFKDDAMLSEGDCVEAKHRCRGQWLPATVMHQDRATGKCSLRYADGTGRVEEGVELDYVRPRAASTLPLTPGSPANFASDKDAVLAAVASYGSALRWVDPGGGAGLSVAHDDAERTAPRLGAVLGSGAPERTFEVTVTIDLDESRSIVAASPDAPPVAALNYQIELELSASTAELKSKIATRTGIPAMQQYLYITKGAAAPKASSSMSKVYPLTLQDIVKDTLDEYQGADGGDSASLKPQVIHMVKLIAQRSNADHRYNLREDNDVVAVAVSSFGPALAFAGDAMQNNREMVRLAVTESWRALEYASLAIRSDSNFLCKLIEEGHGSRYMDGLGIQFCDATALEVSFVEESGDASASNRRLLLAAVKSNGAVLFSQRFMNDQNGIFASLRSQYNSASREATRSAIRRFIGELCTGALTEGGSIDAFPLVAAFVEDDERRRFTDQIDSAVTYDHIKIGEMVELSFEVSASDLWDKEWYTQLMGEYRVSGSRVNGARMYTKKMDKPIIGTNTLGNHYNYPAMHLLRNKNGIWVVGVFDGDADVLDGDKGILLRCRTEDANSDSPIGIVWQVWQVMVWKDDAMKCTPYTGDFLNEGDHVYAMPSGSHSRSTSNKLELALPNKTDDTTWLAGTILENNSATQTCRVKFDESDTETLNAMAAITARDVLRGMVLSGLDRHPQHLDSVDLNSYDDHHFGKSQCRVLFHEICSLPSDHCFESVVAYFFETEFFYLSSAVELGTEEAHWPQGKMIYAGDRAPFVKERAVIDEYSLEDDNLEDLENLDSIFITSLLGCSQGFGVLITRIEVRRRLLLHALSLSLSFISIYLFFLSARLFLSMYGMSARL